MVHANNQNIIHQDLSAKNIQVFFDQSLKSNNILLCI